MPRIDPLQQRAVVLFPASLLRLPVLVMHHALNQSELALVIHIHHYQVSSALIDPRKIGGEMVVTRML